jgi:hypothetical protein
MPVLVVLSILTFPFFVVRFPQQEQSEAQRQTDNLPQTTYKQLNTQYRHPTHLQQPETKLLLQLTFQRRPTRGTDFFEQHSWKLYCRLRMVLI